MDFLEACQTLNAWIVQSQGSPIALPSGKEAAFTRLMCYQERDILAFEDAWQVHLPEDYREFLLQVGASACFMNKYQRGVNFHCLQDIPDFSAQVFAARESTNLFPSLLLAVSLSGGEEGGFYFHRPAPALFNVFLPDIFPDIDYEDWTMEMTNWCSFSDWLTRLVTSEGEERIP